MPPRNDYTNAYAISQFIKNDVNEGRGLTCATNASNIINTIKTGNVSLNNITVSSTTDRDMSFEAEITIHDRETLDKIFGKPTPEKKTASPLPVPTYISVRGKATVVHWEDGTHTAVLCGDTDNSNVYAAYCAALAKKIYGTTSAVHKFVDKHLSENINKRKQEAADQQRREQEERAKLNEDREVRRMAKKIVLESRAADLANRILEADEWKVD